MFVIMVMDENSGITHLLLLTQHPASQIYSINRHTCISEWREKERAGDCQLFLPCSHKRSLTHHC